jgi:hypothetical protein
MNHNFKNEYIAIDIYDDKTPENLGIFVAIGSNLAII